MSSGLNVVLIHPQIPQNTGNIGRLCVNTDSRLHLIRPLGFRLDAANRRRAGLDYWSHLNWRVHDDWDAFIRECHPRDLRFVSTRGHRSVFDVSYDKNAWLVFGNETDGLPADFYERYRDRLCRIPMPGTNARSLNLANSVAIVVYEALRQVQNW